MENKTTKSKAKKKEIVEVHEAVAVPVQKISEMETVEDRVQFEVQKFNFVDSEIEALKKKFSKLEVKSVDDKNGIKTLTEALAVVRNLRTGINKKREELKDFYLNTGRGIDAEAKRIQSLIAEVEEPLKAKKLEIDNQIQAIKDEEERLEKESLDKKVDALKEAGIQFDGTFYSIGENISVDLGTIKDLDEEAFERLRSMVAIEKAKIDNEVLLQKLHEERKESILPFWSFLTPEIQESNFSDISEERFNDILLQAKVKKDDFDQIQANQKAEAEKQIQERKDLNFEKRSFRFEKEGFEIVEDGVWFANEIGNVSMSRRQIEELNNPEFEEAFELKIGNKSAFEAEFLQLSEKRKQDAEAEAEKKIQAEKQKQFNERLSSRESAFKTIGWKRNEGKLIFEDLEVDLAELGEMSESEFGTLLTIATKRKAEFDAENAKKEEQDRISKLSEIEKIERYCQEVLNVYVPEVNDGHLANEIQVLRRQIKGLVDSTLSNLKNL